LVELLLRITAYKPIQTASTERKEKWKI